MGGGKGAKERLEVEDLPSSVLASPKGYADLWQLYYYVVLIVKHKTGNIISCTIADTCCPTVRLLFII